MSVPPIAVDESLRNVERSPVVPTPMPGLFGPLNPVVDSWHGRHVWVVGASSGIGHALARALIRRGAVVAVSARRRAPLETLAASNPGVEVLDFDVADASATRAAAETLARRWPRIDLVLWLAGIYDPMRATDFDLARARRMIEANLMGPLNGLDALLPTLLAQKHGGFALVASVAGYSGLPQALIYGPTKAALINLAESLYLDLRPHGIGVHLINPGFVETPATAVNDFRMPALQTPEQAAERTLAGIAAGRFEVHFPRRFTTWLKFARCLPYRLYFSCVRLATGLRHG